MAIAEKISPDAHGDAQCQLAARWTLSPELSYRLHQMVLVLPFSLSIISGWRSREHQEELIRSGKGAADHLSTHRACPATGADLWPSVAVTDAVRREFGRAAQLAGLRWGGGSPLVDGIPSDWNHVDLGPRSG